MTAFLKAHSKAISGFISAEAATFLVLLQSGDINLRGILTAALTPLGAGYAVHRTTNAANP